MGGDGTIVFKGVEAKTARTASAAAAAEIDRLEDALSLFRTSSELRRLNRDKMLHSPSGDMRRALALASISPTSAQDCSTRPFSRSGKRM